MPTVSIQYLGDEVATVLAQCSHIVRGAMSMLSLGDEPARSTTAAEPEERRENRKAQETEKKIVESVERGEWRSVRGLKSDRTRYARYRQAALARLRDHIEHFRVYGSPGTGPNAGGGTLWCVAAS